MCRRLTTQRTVWTYWWEKIVRNYGTVNFTYAVCNIDTILKLYVKNWFMIWQTCSYKTSHTRCLCIHLCRVPYTSSYRFWSFSTTYRQLTSVHTLAELLNRRRSGQWVWCVSVAITWKVNKQHFICNRGLLGAPHGGACFWSSVKRFHHGVNTGA